ncbi:MAG: 2-hydroxyglutaryl-CoA dehydratase [Deltaproteobacteria bacterium]|nr:2-hydroxyglutaryl-CoA dehydratase [Deltaproteobacteria bacterium]
MGEGNSSALVAGVDVGAATSKTVLFREGRLLAYEIMHTGHDVKLAAEKVTETALKKIGLVMSDLAQVVSTGYGRDAVYFSHSVMTEILCHARGAHFMNPDTSAVIDIGGQDSKVIELDKDGNVVDFVMNDKCAAGTGRFLEVMANILELKVEELGPISMTSQDPCRITNTCTIFAESELISLRAEGRRREDLIAGVHKAVASRVAIMARQLRLGETAMFTGGVAKNQGVKLALEQELGLGLVLPEEPQIIGALGAALLAAAAVSNK